MVDIFLWTNQRPDSHFSNNERDCYSSAFVAQVMARAATELSISLLGGQHRLAPNNSHQVPVAVFLAGPSDVGVLALAAAR